MSQSEVIALSVHHFHYAYSVYQLEYSRNLIFTSGRRMEQLFDTIVDRTRTRLDIPAVRSLFGVGQRPRRPDPGLSPRQGVIIQRSQWNLTIFKIHFGLLTLKAYTKGERVCPCQRHLSATDHARSRPVIQDVPTTAVPEERARWRNVVTRSAGVSGD